MRRALPILLLATGCAGEGRYVDSPVYRKPYDDVFRITREEIEKRYAIMTADPVKGVIESRWDTQLGVFKETGTRRRGKAKIEGKPNGAVLVHLQAPVETNSSVKHTLIESEAAWDKSGFDETEEQVLLRHIRFRLATFRPPEDAPEVPAK